MDFTSTSLHRRLVTLGLNAGIAAIIGFWLAGWLGGLGALVAVPLLALSPIWLPRVYRGVLARPSARARKIAIVAWLAIRPILALLLMPIVLPLTVILALVLQGWSAARAVILRPFEPVLRSIKFLGRRSAAFLTTFVVGPTLSLTIMNALAAVLIVGVLWQVDFAGYVIFAFLPLMIAFLFASSADYSAPVD